MCNDYANRKSLMEVARYFNVTVPDLSFNAPSEIYPGQPGLVLHAMNGAAALQSMVWGFPIRLKGMKPDSKPKPVNNVADLTKFMWRSTAAKPAGRCLIPLTEFAEAEGPKGAKSKTWFRVKGRELFSWAGLCRNSDEWGPVYSGVMTDANAAVAPVHDRMPVLLLPEDHDRWMTGGFDDLLALQARVFPPDLMTMERTEELWVKKRGADAAAQGS